MFSYDGLCYTPSEEAASEEAGSEEAASEEAACEEEDTDYCYELEATCQNSETCKYTSEVVSVHASYVVYLCDDFA